MHTLYGRTSNQITLQAALKNCASRLTKGSHGVALLYSPTCCQFAKVQPNGNVTDSNDECLELKNVFEARAFNETCELRWLNEFDGQGRAVLISSEQNIVSLLSENISVLEGLDTIKQAYILWGKGVKNISIPGWGKLAAARIGSLSVPITGLTTNQQVYLNSIEYLQEIDDYGNVAVVEERLIGLEVK